MTIIRDNAKARRADLAFIHMGAKALGMDDATYRAMLYAVGRVYSAKDLDYAGRQRVKDHLVRSGFKPPRPMRAAPAGKKPIVAADRQPLINKIEAMLAESGKPWNYARAMAERMFKLQLEWCTPDHLHRLVAALEINKRRNAREAT